jgi:hypothetical protein
MQPFTKEEGTNGHTWAAVRKAHYTKVLMVVKPGENYQVGCPEAMWEE